VRKAEVERSLFEAETGREIAQTALNIMIGRPTESVWDADAASLLPPAVTSDRDTTDGETFALAHRPELLALDHQAEAARRNQAVARGDMLPELNLVLKSNHVEGAGSMQPANEYFAGALLSWNVWDWGTAYYQLKSAAAIRQKALAGRQAKADGVRLEVTRKRLEWERTQKDIRVAKVQLTQANENLRLEQLRYTARENTTTDLLEAQTLATKSENALIIAEMQAVAAGYAYNIASGRDLLGATEQR
jgi:outer membrane protein TolC